MISFPDDWLGELSIDDTLDVAITFARREAELAGSLRSAMLDLLDRRAFSELVDFELEYDEDVCVMDYIHARQCLGFFQKLEPLGEVLGLDREAAAWEKFLKSELDCLLTNEIFRLERQGKLCFLPEVSSALLAARFKIARILGPVPSFGSLKPLLGPGASTTVLRKRAVPAEKLVGSLACSTNTIPWLPSIFGQHPHLLYANSSHSVDEEANEDVWTAVIREDRGRLSFVPKDAKSFRSIVVEPSLTSYYQLGIGNYIATRLRGTGIDIHNQETNQNLARLGSVRGSLATLDLSSASDTISTELVRYLVPDDWYSLLCGFRSGVVEYQGEPIVLEKFSSMGNGYTFPLETLIFYALTWAASPHHERSFINAYGDDLVCGSESATSVVSLLNYCGFTVNKTKSYTDGPFRESCGADFFRGINIRPYRLKSLLSVEKLFSLHNWYFRHWDEEGCNLVLSFIPPSLRIWGPDGYGDGHLLCNLPLRRLHRRHDGWGGFVFDTLTTKPKKSTRVLPGDYLQVLYSIYARDSGESQAHEREFPALSSNWRVVKTYPSSSRRRYKRISIYTLSVG
nr:MAG: RNA dependent RNA polymerase [Leviviridae sp.]